MKGFLLLLCLPVWSARAQGDLAPALDANSLELARRVVLPGVALFLLGYFVVGAIKLLLNFLLKRQILAAGVSEKIAERLLPNPRDEQRKVVKWVALLLSTAAGLWVCTRFLPLGIHSVIVLLLSTALGFVAYYLYLRRQPQ